MKLIYLAKCNIEYFFCCSFQNKRAMQAPIILPVVLLILFGLSVSEGLKESDDHVNRADYNYPSLVSSDYDGDYDWTPENETKWLNETSDPPYQVIDDPAISNRSDREKETLGYSFGSTAMSNKTGWYKADEKTNETQSNSSYPLLNDSESTENPAIPTLDVETSSTESLPIELLPNLTGRAFPPNPDNDTEEIFASPLVPTPINGSDFDTFALPIKVFDKTSTDPLAPFGNRSLPFLPAPTNGTPFLPFNSSSEFSFLEPNNAEVLTSLLTGSGNKPGESDKVKHVAAVYEKVPLQSL